MAARIACSPKTDARRVDIIKGLKIADRSAPIFDLPPRIDVVAGKPAAATEISMIVEQHNEASLGNSLRERLETVEFRGTEAVGHRHRGKRRADVSGAKQPGFQFRTVLRWKLDVNPIDHCLLSLVGISRTPNISKTRNSLASSEAIC